MKAIYNNTTNSLIAFKGDHRPIQICKGGQLIDNISAVPLITEQDTYTSEYKANLVGLELQGNTEQNPNVSPTTPQTIKNSGDSVAITTIPITKSGFDSIYINGITSYEEIPSLFDNVTLYAQEKADAGNIDVELSGVNLADMYAYTPYNSVTKVTISTLENGDISMVNGGAYTDLWTGTQGQSNTTYIQGKNPLLKAGTYTISVRRVTNTYFCSLISATTNTRVKFLTSFSTVGEIRYTTFTIDEDCYLRFGRQSGNATFGDLIVVKGDIIKPYEPYFSPTTVNIPYTLATGDKLTLKDKKVMLNNTDITSSEVGQNLLALAEATQNQTNIITATSEIPLSKKIITYAKWGGDSEN